MAIDISAVAEAIGNGQSLAAADQVLIDPEPGALAARVEELLSVLQNDDYPADEVCRTLIRLGMNFVGRDAEIVGYGTDESDRALDQVLAVIDDLEGAVMADVVTEFLADMNSVNLSDSLSGLLAERIEAELNNASPGRSFLTLLNQQMRGGVYWRMVGDNYCKFGNDFARGLEYLRHYGFCQVSTNPVLAAKAFDEDGSLAEQLKSEIEHHDEWKRDPEAHADEIAMAATLIALWPNLSIFRPLAVHTDLKDYMVSFQLNPNIADRADESIEDARNAYRLAADFLEGYDRLLGLGDRSGRVRPNIVFKVAASHEAARKITTTLNGNAIGSNNTVVYTVAQEVQLILDAFEGKARAAKAGEQVVRTYETNMGGRFVSHLREVEAEKIFLAAAARTGEGRANELLGALAADLGTEDSPDGSLADRAQAVCAYANLKSLDHPIVLEAAESAGQSADAIRHLEEDLKKAGTLVARRVYRVFFSPENRPKWVDHLRKTYGVTDDQARWIVDSMDVLPASKRIPEDSFHTLGASNMCNTEFPNHARAVQMASEVDGFDLEDFRDAVLDTYEPGVDQRLRELPDFCRGYDLTPSLKDYLVNVVGIDVTGWQTRGLEPGDWPDFGSVQKTSAEFRAAYDTFAARCIAIAKEVSG
ncbi:MAG: hypothetical protein OXR72_09005 [Gemmatimonadota bacterium]|nr:hypothetical protein [Gemmatimonadota bacterium]